MNAPPTRRRSLVLPVVLLPLALAACGRVPGQFEILNDQVPQGAAGGGCTIPVDPTQYRGDGRLDLAIVNYGTAESAYYFFPLIENNLPGATGAASDPNQIQMTGFNVDITPYEDAPVAFASVLAGNPLAHFQTPWSGGISSGGGKLSAIVSAFPVALAAQLLQAGGVGAEPSLTVHLRVQAIGTTTFGTEMQSDPFDFPVEVCDGCLVANVQACPYTSAPTNTGNPCNAAQDDFVDCCSDNGALICPPIVVSTPNSADGGT